MGRSNAEAQNRLDVIDGMRGVACMYVVLYHVFLLWPVAQHEVDGRMSVLRFLTSFAAYGHIGVDIFLAISGFCLFLPICRAAAADGALVSVPPFLRFLVRRARRILPAYIAVVVLFSALPWWSTWAVFVQDMPAPVDVGTHLLMIHNLLPQTILRIDGPLWSLALEAQIYLIFPLAIVLFRVFGATRFIVGVLTASVVYRFVMWDWFAARTMSLESQFVVMNSVPGRFFEFALGMLAAYLLTRSLRSHQRAWLKVSVLVILTVGPLVAYLADKAFGERSPIPTLGWGLVAFGLIVAATHGWIPLLHALRWRPVVLVGAASYSIYLLHEPLLRLTGGFVATLGTAPVVALVLFVLTVGPIILLLSFGWFLVFERPFLRARRATVRSEVVPIPSPTHPVAAASLHDRAVLNRSSIASAGAVNNSNLRSG
jgi:peptidoglycan/LPS O-acetylase OafA/YrhL